MKNKRILICFLTVLISLAAFFSLSTPLVSGNGDTIPTGYCQQLNLNGTYVYNVSFFGNPWIWYNNSAWPNNTHGNFETNPGGQIKVNFTGFYNRDPLDIYGDAFPDSNMPWMDVEIFKKEEITANFTRYNCSNSESATNLYLSYGDFKPGFLVPINNFTLLKEWANIGAEVVWAPADLTIEDTYNFIYFGFNQIGGGQQTELIYDRTTGLLVWANTILGGFSLEMQSLNFTLDYDRTYEYDVQKFGEPYNWWNFTGPEGYYNTTPNGVISINFTGDYDKDPNDWGNVFEDPIPWINISIFKNITGSLHLNFSLINKSNSEAARSLNIGYNEFQSGFRMPVDNLSYVEQVAKEQGDVGLIGEVDYKESNLTIFITYIQSEGSQKTFMIYEKWTGLLLWVNTSLGTYLLEMAIEGYSPWLDDTTSESGPPASPLRDVVYLPYLIVIIASVAIVVPFEFVPRASSKSKKYALLAMIAVSCFSGLLFFNNNMNLLLGTSTLNQRVDNITLIVDYGNGTVDTFPSFTLLSGKTSAYDALDAWCSVRLEYFPGLGNQVVAINGYEPGGGWTYSIDGEYAGEITTTGLNNGDTVRFTAH